MTPFKTCAAVYGMYIVSMLMQFSLATSLYGTILVTVALVMAYRGRKKAAGDAVFENQFHWQLRTFWIGGGVLLPAVTVIASLAAFWEIDLESVKAQIADGALLDIQTVTQYFLAKNGGLIMRDMMIGTAVVSLWWFYRCWEGIRFLRQGQPVPKVMRWF